MAIGEFEKLAYDTNGENLCKPIVLSKQRANIELEVICMDDIEGIKHFMNKLGYRRTFFGCENNKVFMEYERG